MLAGSWPWPGISGLAWTEAMAAWGDGAGGATGAQSRADGEALSSRRRGRRTWSGRPRSRGWEGTTVEGCVVACVAAVYDIIGRRGGGRGLFGDGGDGRASGVRSSQSRVVSRRRRQSAQFASGRRQRHRRTQKASRTALRVGKSVLRGWGDAGASLGDIGMGGERLRGLSSLSVCPRAKGVSGLAGRRVM